MFSIYPLRGTNELNTTSFPSSFANLSPTGDEQTFFLFMKYLTCSFIPYGGRTNLSAFKGFRLVKIYPLRGTNKLFSLSFSVGRFNLSPTGDEQTSQVCHNAKLWVFIPYGGRTNVASDEPTHDGRIYPLRGTNKPHNPGNQC